MHRLNTAWGQQIEKLLTKCCIPKVWEPWSKIEQKFKKISNT